MSQSALRTILHIDDDAGLRFLMREVAEEGARPQASPIRWLEAGGVSEAVERYRTERPDLVLLDNRLRGAEGVDLLSQVRAAWGCPVWILTGAPDEALERRAVAGGAAGVASKDELLEDPARLRGFLQAAADPRPASLQS